MAVSEIPNNGQAYRVQPLDKDQASQQDVYHRRGKKEKDASKKPDSEKTIRLCDKGRIDLLV